MCASYLWNPATNCGRSVISIFLAIVVPRRPPAVTHAAICVITSVLGAMWPSVAAIPPLTPICNKTDNILYHKNYDLTFHNLVVTICTIMFNTTNHVHTEASFSHFPTKEKCIFSPCQGCSPAWRWSEHWDRPTLRCSTVRTPGKTSGEFHCNHLLHPIHTVLGRLPQGLHTGCCTQVGLWVCNTNNERYNPTETPWYQVWWECTHEKYR